MVQYQFGVVGEIEGIDISNCKKHLETISKEFPDGVLVRYAQGKWELECQKMAEKRFLCILAYLIGYVI